MTTLQAVLLAAGIYTVLAFGAWWVGTAFLRSNSRRYGAQNDAGRIVGALKERN